MQGIVNRIYRERRRLALVVCLAAIAGYLFYAHLPYEVGGLPVAWFSAALYAVFVGVSTLTICLVFPGFRFAMEAFAVSRLIYAGFVASFPALGAATVQEPFINATIVVAGGFALSLIFYSDWLGRRFVTENPVATVRLPRRLRGEARLSVSDDALARIAYTRGGPAARGALHALVTDSARDLRLDHDTETGTVLLRVRHATLPLRTRIAAWLDDSYGRVLDLEAQALLAPAAVDPAPAPARQATAA